MQAYDDVENEQTNDTAARQSPPIPGRSLSYFYNPSREATYRMAGSERPGSVMDVPYSMVGSAASRGYHFLNDQEHGRYLENRDFALQPEGIGKSAKGLWGWFNTTIPAAEAFIQKEEQKHGLNNAPTYQEAENWQEHPNLEAAKLFAKGFTADAARMLATPMGLLAAAGGAYLKAAGAVPVLASELPDVAPVVRTAFRASGGIYAGQGGYNLYKDAPNYRTMDGLQRLAGDGAMLTGGVLALRPQPHLVSSVEDLVRPESERLSPQEQAAIDLSKALKVPEDARASFENATIAETSTILDFMRRHKLSINSTRDLAKVSNLAAQEVLAQHANLSPEEIAGLQDRVRNLKVIEDQATASARLNEHAPQPGFSDIPLDKGAGPLVQGGLKWFGGGPEYEGNRAVRSSIQKASSEMKGTGAWINRGSKVLIAAGVGDSVISQLLSTPEGQQLVIEAGNLSLGSRRLAAILQQLSYGPKP